MGSFCNANCNGVCEYTAARAAQTASFALRHVKLAAGQNHSLALWRSQLGLNISEDQLFQQLPDVPIAQDNGIVTLTVVPDAVYTLSSVRTASKAGGGKRRLVQAIPKSRAFPLPYADDFEQSTPPSPGTTLRNSPRNNPSKQSARLAC